MLVVTSLLACSHASTGTAPPALDHEVLYSGAQCGAIDKDPSLLWLSEREGLEAVYRKLNGHMLGKKSPVPPVVDFGAGGVLVVYMGLKPTAGYALSIRGSAIKRVNGGLDVEVDWVEPAPGSLVAQALTSPCFIIKIEAGDYERIRVIDGNGKTRATLAMRRPIKRQ
jgi:hypothetical protein